MARSLSKCGFRPKNRRNHNLTIPLERYVEQMEVSYVSSFVMMLMSLLRFRNLICDNINCLTVCWTIQL